MRIISGSKKGVTVRAVPGTTTRPTTDKVRESLFQIIGPYFEGGSMLDLYGGSGVVGLEALSRGIDSVIYVDKDPKAVRVIKQNIGTAGFESQTEVYRNDAGRALKAVIRRHKQFDLIFLDPPYDNNQLVNELHVIDEGNLLKERGLIIVEHRKGTYLPDEFNNFVLWRSDNYGITEMTLYEWRQTE